jgi:hypothetical protein
MGAPETAEARQSRDRRIGLAGCDIRARLADFARTHFPTPICALFRWLPNVEHGTVRPRAMRPRLTEEIVMGKYLLALVLGVPAVVLVVIYFLAH